MAEELALVWNLFGDSNFSRVCGPAVKDSKLAGIAVVEMSGGSLSTSRLITQERAAHALPIQDLLVLVFTSRSILDTH